MKRLYRKLDFLNTIEKHNSLAIASWIGDSDVVVESGSDLIQSAPRQNGSLATLAQAVQHAANVIESGNSFEVLICHEGEICKLDMETLFPHNDDDDQHLHIAQ